MAKLVRLARILRPYWRYVAQSLAVATVMLLASIPGPYLTKVLVDDVFPHRDASLLTIVLGAVAAISIGTSVSNFLSSHFGTCVGVKMGYDLKSSFYRHIQGLDFSFFDGRETGEVLARFRDMDASIGGIIGIVDTLALNTFQLLIFPPILFFINWKLALISLVVLPFDSALALMTRNYLRRLSKEIAEANARLSAKAYESLSGIRTIQALSLEYPFYQKLLALFHDVARLRVRASVFQGGAGLLASFFRVAGTLAYGLYGWRQVLSGQLSLGGFLAFSGYVGFLYGPVERLIGLIGQVEVSLVHMDRFLEIYDSRPVIRELSSAKALCVSQGEIMFREVTFGYTPDRPVLRKFDLTISGGSTVALVGPSGAGKSTLAKLIPRFYDPQGGSVLIDGTDLRSVRLSSIRSQVGFALQGTSLFHGTILENLRCGRDIPVSDIRDACRAANADVFIQDLARAYETEVGEAGSQLSEGQKQRIALARVLLLDTPILILDEPTSSLDEDSAQKVRDALMVVREGRTTVLIAHRAETVAAADEVVAFSTDGRLQGETANA